MATKAAVNKKQSPRNDGSIEAMARAVLLGEDTRSQFEDNIKNKRSIDPEFATPKFSGNENHDDVSDSLVDDVHDSVEDDFEADGINAARRIGPNATPPGAPPVVGSEPIKKPLSNRGEDGQTRVKYRDDGVAEELEEEVPMNLPEHDDNHKEFEKDTSKDRRWEFTSEEPRDGVVTDDDRDFRDEVEDDEGEAGGARNQGGSIKEEEGKEGKFRFLRKRLKEEDKEDKPLFKKKHDDDDDEDDDDHHDHEDHEDDDDDDDDHDHKKKGGDKKIEIDVKEELKPHRPRIGNRHPVNPAARAGHHMHEEGDYPEFKKNTTNSSLTKANAQGPHDDGVVGDQDKGTPGNEDKGTEGHADESGVGELVKSYVKDREGVSVDEDVKALLHGETLTEDFKSKTKTIFEAAVIRRATEVAELVEERLMEDFAASEQELRRQLTEQVNDYLNYMVEEWIAQNEVAIEHGLRAELAEDFIGGLHQLFLENYIDIPEQKVDVVTALAEKVEKLEATLSEEVERGVRINKELLEYKKEDVLRSITEDLTDVQFSKLRQLTENVDFASERDFVKKVSVLKENYFPTKTFKKHYDANGLDDDASVDDGKPHESTKINLAEEVDEQKIADKKIRSYMSAISSTVRR